MILPKIRYEDMTWPQLQKAAKLDPVIVQPIGAIEAHGRHLPLSTDTMQVNNIAYLASQRAAEKIPLLLMPTVPWGFSSLQMDMPAPKDRFPGTITLSAQMLMNLCAEIAQSLVRAGFKRIFLLSGHGGNYQPLMTAARTIRDLTDAMVAAANYYLLCDAAKLCAIIEEGTLKHAAEWETALAMALDNENIDYRELKHDAKAVRAIKVKTKYASRDEMGGKLFSAKVFVAEKNPDFSSGGVVGNAPLATAEKGRRAVELHVNSVAEFLVEFKKWKYGAM